MGWDNLNAFYEWLASAWTSVVPAATVDFPAEPSSGETFGRFEWNPNKGTWDLA